MSARRQCWTYTQTDRQAYLDSGVERPVEGLIRGLFGCPKVFWVLLGPLEVTSATAGIGECDA
jgi:hypothetical protein